MSETNETQRGFSLARWSRRKLEAARAAETSALPPTPATAVAPASAAAAASPDTPAGGAAPLPLELPAIDSLSFESDFSAFLQPEVDESLRRQALKKLFSDPRFNVMDGLDIYIDDYGKPDPIEPELVRQLVQGRYLFDPPRTRVNEQGVVEDIPAEPVPEAGADAESALAAGDALPAAAAPLPVPELRPVAGPGTTLLPATTTPTVTSPSSTTDS